MRYVALLGGINVGGHRVKMEALRAEFEALGFGQVATFIASGNVVFESARADGAALEGLVAERLGAALGYRVPVFIRTLEELRAIAAHEPFPPEARGEGDTLSIMFLAAPLPDELHASLHAFRTPMDELRAHRREVYWLCRGRTSDSLVDWPRLARTVGLPAATMRNSTTVRRLVAKHAGEA